MKNKNSEIKIFDSPELLAEYFAEKFKQLSDNVILSKGSMNVALSGGQTPKLLFTILEKKYLNAIDWKRINFYWADERCVTEESNESNFGEAYRLLFKDTDHKNNLYRIIGENDPAEEAIRYSDEIKKNLQSENGFPKFDLMLLGLGEDGHTASIFPDQMELLESDKICEVAIHPVSKQKRITLTGKVINNSDRIYFLITGKGKSEVVKKIIERENGYEKFPAAHIKNIDGENYRYLNKEAASLLKT